MRSESRANMGSPDDSGDGTDDFLSRALPGSSEAILALRRLVQRLNSSTRIGLVRSLLIRGETGAGKNHLARVIAGHRRWRAIRNTKADPGLEAGLDPFCDRFGEIHLPGVPEHLVESELFGHKKGAFTGAEKDKLGLLAGDTDDILLDEIGDISAALQTKLLGVLEHGRFRPLGADLDDDEGTNARLLMATNRPLENLMRAGKFRHDLYHRMRLFVVTVPPLREQPENIAAIARELEGDIRRGMPVNLSADNEIHLSEADIRWARSYHWPGNARELRDSIIRWLFEDGRRPLQQIVQELGDVERSAASRTELSATVAGLVSERLDAARQAGTPAASTLSDFVKDFEREAKAAVAAWYRAARPSDQLLRQIFPGHRRLESIRNKLSQWRKS